MMALSVRDFYIGIICALPREFDAVTCMLDTEYKPPFDRLPQSENTAYVFRYGRMSDHNVAIVCLPSGKTGTISSATVSVKLMANFPNIKYGLMVGIGGGSPGPGPENDIRLGDIVVSQPGDRYGGVVQYDFGKTIAQGKFVRHGGILNKPPDYLLSAAAELLTKHVQGKSRIMDNFRDMITRDANRTEYFVAPDIDTDVLYEATYQHPEGQQTCEQCDSTKTRMRPERALEGPFIHHGLIASGDQVMRDGVTRDALRDELGVMCFEMEGAGLMDNLPSLVIRGICDYADTHKNKAWQNYAAAIAAAYVKSFLQCLPPEKGLTDNDIKAAHRWLSKHPEREIHKDNLSKRQDGTNIWFIESREFNEWLNAPEKSFLWIRGIPGAGKTIIASTVIDTLQAHVETRNIALAFFYCTFTNNETTDYQAILGSLVSQVCYRSRSALQSLVDHQRAKLAYNVEQQFVLPDTDALIDILQRGLNDLDSIVLVIDALDECSDRALITRKFRDIFENTTGNLKILATSRSESAIEKSFQGLPDIWLTDYTHHDVKIFVDSRVDSMRNDTDEENISDDVLREVRITIPRIAGNMFLLARYQMELIEDCDCDDEVQEALEDLPGDIDKMYVRILEKLADLVRNHDGRRQRQHAIIQWLVAAKRPLKLEELAEAVTIRPGQQELRKTGVVHGRRLTDICGPLVYVNETTKEVTLCHFSVKEFLIKDRFAEAISDPSHSRLHSYRVDLQQAHEQLATSCLIYLSFETFKNPYVDEDDLNRRRQENCFLDYAAYHVGEHCRELSSCSDSLVAYLDNLFLPEQQLSSIQSSELASRINGYRALATFSVLCPPVGDEYCGCYTSNIHGEFGGWQSINGTDLAQPSDEDGVSLVKMCKEHQQQTVASHPSCRSWLQLYRILAPGTRKDHHGNITPLYFAALFNWRAGVEVYLKRIQDRLTTSDLNHALRGAAIGGSNRDEDKNICAELITILIQAGAEVNSHVPDLGSALQSAAFCSNLEATEVLFRHGAKLDEDEDIYRPGGTAGGALQSAAMAGNQKLVEMLIDNGANVNRVGAWGGTALNVSISNVNIDLISCLLDRGADPAIHAGYNTSTLHHLAGHYVPDSAKASAMLQLVLERRGAGVNLNPYPYGTPLQQACFSGKRDKARILLSAGADILAESGQFGDAIQAASMHGNSEIVTDLLDKGAKPDSDARLLTSRWSVDFEVPFYGRITVLQGGLGLVDHWYDAGSSSFNAAFPRFGFYAPALQAAVQWRSDPWNKILLLLENEPTHREGHYGSPLQVAALFGELQNVNALLGGSELRADPNHASGGIFNTALQAASYNGHEKIVNTLLHHGSEINQGGGLYGCALLAAAAAGHEDICRLLIESGADQDQLDTHGWSYSDWRLQRDRASVRTGGSSFRALGPSEFGDGTFKSPQLRLGENRIEVEFQGAPCCTSIEFLFNWVAAGRPWMMGYALSAPSSIAASVLANHPFPPCRSSYFEFTVILAGDEGIISIGVGDELMPRFELPGRFPRSWGYEGSTGKCTGERKDLATFDRFSSGDTVGCGIDWTSGHLYFTKNGRKQG
ncbi:Protein SSH4 [Trichoderma simmonsii]|uniref:Protein SSH4 n=1 Tax=Trichoderma simmonsii TaxID=1491479 RepID=A0A8G0LNU4_9HYPO|nr:Protein SSH4 [Trichoderma simmonsii]